MTRQMTPDEADALARLLVVIRPDWSLTYAIPAVRGMRLIDASLERCVRVAVRGALDQKIRKPDVLAMRGDHWRAAADLQDSEPARHEQCPKCRDYYLPADADKHVCKQRTKGERVVALLETAKAEIHQFNAAQCVHKMPRALCVECQAKPSETEPEDVTA